MNIKDLLFVAIPIVIIGIGCSASKESDLASSRTDLEGTWLGHAANNQGSLMTFVFSGTFFEATSNNRLLYRGTMMLKTDVSPKQADITIKESANAAHVGKKSLAIFEMRDGGNTAVIAANEPGIGVRPASFDVETGSRTAVFILERKKTNVVSKMEIGSNRDALINDLNNLAAFSYQYRIRPSNLGGGNGAFTGITLPDKLRSNENGTFTFTVVGPDELKIKAISKNVEGAAIETTLDGDGRLSKWTYFGRFM